MAICKEGIRYNNIPLSYFYYLINPCQQPDYLAIPKIPSCVINICSAVGRIVQPNFSVYGTVKAGLIHMTRLMASELAPDVRVNGIAPGSILTDALRGLLDEANLQKMCDRTPMKKLGEVDDIALAALYLASPAAEWVTGKILEIDGGMETTNMPS